MNSWIENAQLGSALLKGSGLLLVTFLSILLMRSASATSQFRVCFVGVGMSLLVAVASLVAPLCNLELSIEHNQSVLAANTIVTPSSYQVSGERLNKFDKPGLPSPSAEHSLNSFKSMLPGPSTSHLPQTGGESAERPDFRSAHTAGNIETDNSDRVKPSVQSWMKSILVWWPCAWGIGAAAILLQMLIAHLHAFRAFSQCTKLEDQAALQLSEEISQRLVISAPELLVCMDSITPFVAGVWKPKIVLPLDSVRWSSQKLTFVLLHEMAHIKRRDLLTQLLSSVAVAVYWFNPLSWWSFAQLMRLRELACDDCVLLQEQNPASYAETLLDVASRYRLHGQATVIGMSGKLDIARRIHSALDATRARKSFSQIASLWVVGGSLVLCLVLGAVQLRARALEPQDESQTTGTENKESEPIAEAKKEKPVDEEARSMTIKVVDEQSRPLEGVDVRVTGVDYERRGGSGNLPRVHYPTDALGQTRIKFREGTLSLQLWPSKQGYVPQYVEFDEKKLALPPETTFYFEKGERLAGKVVDTTGNPIENATVQVNTSGTVELNERAQQSFPPATCNNWLAEGEQAAKTNAEGEWEIQNAPSAARNPELKFELLVDHPDFAGDRRWGAYQNKQGITTEQLRSGAAILVMDVGVILRGKIVGPNGEPVTKGLVIWVSNPYFATGVNEVEIQSDGTYQLPNLEPGKYPITVVAPGFAPDQREVELSQGATTCDFQLEAGNPITIEIVDTSGNPIPNASVSFARDGWRGTSAIYNNDHPNVPASGIPRHADENGIFTWEWAPSDGVHYNIFKTPYDTKSVTLIAQAETHRIVLTSPMTIFGSVVDAKSDRPIDRFTVIPVKAFRPDFYSTDFQESRGARGAYGKYELRVNSQGEPTDRYFVRIEADGYRTALGANSLASGEPPLEEDFRLEPVAPLVGRVETQAAEPANKFQVAIGTATTSPHFQFDYPETAFGQAFAVDGDSTFKIAASFEPQRLRVFNKDGFAELVVQPEQPEIGKVVLQPYANVSGRLMQGTVPIGNEVVYFYPLVQRGLKEARFEESFYTKTDSNGTFDFGRLPPMAGYVGAYLGPWRESTLSSSQSVPLDLHPGEHKQLTLSGSGIPVSGRVVATGRGDDKFSKRWSLNWLVSRQAGIPLPSDASPLSIPSISGPIDSAWLKHTDFSAWLATKQNHYVKLRDDGLFKIHGVPAGEYDLVIQLYEQPAGCLVEAVGTRVVPVSVRDEQVSAGELDLGAIEVECRSGPRPGSDMRAYKFVSSDGRVIHVDDLSGRYLIFHVWASWCAPCLASMPQLKADLDDLESAPLTAIGINVDADKKRGQAIAEDLGLARAQNYVGEDSDLARQLSVSSVPAYYLIGPDGMLIGSSGEWSEIQKLLQEKLEQ